MSGSGSSVFALTTDIKLLKKLEVLLEDKYIVEITKIKK
jgi:4-diphosphocytidyl-2C-methyl-D-erythritol kinase